MSETLRKMGFWEIGKNSKNSLVNKVQSLFEEAQLEAFQRGVKTTVTLQIKVMPPAAADEDGRWGKVSFGANLSVPKEAEKEFTTQLVDGLIVSTGTSESDILQYKLNFPELEKPENVSPFPIQNQ